MGETADPGLLRNAKERIRTTCRNRRASMTDDEIQRTSKAICDQVWTLIGDKTHIASYLAFDNEVDLTPLHQQCWSAGKRLFFPRVIGRQKMEFARCEGPGELRVGRFGIQEPTGETTSLATIDAILIPGLAFDRQGGRLGFGAGFYDRALQPLMSATPVQRAVLIGVGYSWQVSHELLPTSNLDVALDRIATEEGVVTIRRLCAGFGALK
jgi:5-formyltetrahydrofolate cyclo-ligase